MSLQREKIVELQSCLSELQAELAAKRTTVEEQHEQIRGLVAENERLKGIFTFHTVEVQEKNAEVQKLRDRLQALEEELDHSRREHQESISEVGKAKSKAQLECQARDATIRKLQMEVDGLIMENDDLKDAYTKKAAELDTIVENFNRKLHQTIHNEREKVKGVLEHCRSIIAQLNEKAKESNDKNLSVENEMRAKIETLLNFREEIAEQTRIYGEWVALLRQQANKELAVQGTPEEGPTLTLEKEQIKIPRQNLDHPENERDGS